VSTALAVTDDDIVVLEIVWRGTQAGPLVANRHHQDVLGMLVRLGAMAAPA